MSDPRSSAGAPEGPKSAHSVTKHSATHDAAENAPADSTRAFALICPQCASSLDDLEGNIKFCPKCERKSPRVDGIWRFLTEEQEENHKAYLHNYRALRENEGRRVKDPEYYRALPFQDITGRHVSEWSMRAGSFGALIEHVIEPAEREKGHPLRILDLGAGSCWLSAHLARRGHHIVAVDILGDECDGLGAHKHYLESFAVMQADVDSLPLASGQADLAIFNGSFHSVRYCKVTLEEALRVLRDDGAVIIMDTPIYQNLNDGIRMVKERQEKLRRILGEYPPYDGAVGFLTFDDLERMGATLKIDWSFVRPSHGLGWKLGSLLSRIMGSRESAAYLLAVGRPRRS
jgi:SAM-dependent methyltransferase